MMGVRVLLSVLSIPVSVGLCLAESRHRSDSVPPRAALQQEKPSSPVQPAKGRFLVASRALIDPNFAETVILLLSADAHGSMGIVINRPTHVKLTEVLPDVKALRDRPDRVSLGGPVGGNVMLLLIRSHTPPAQSEKILEEVYATGSMEALRQALGRKGKTESRLHAYAGYAGWGPGQLEHEIARGDWLVGSADAATIFDLPAAAIWPKLIERFSGSWTKEDGLRVPGFGFRVAKQKPNTRNPKLETGDPGQNGTITAQVAAQMSTR